ELRKDVSRVKNAWNLIEVTERFLEAALQRLGLEEDEKPTRIDLYSRNITRIRLPNPEHLLKLDNVVFVEGPAGCGKTTLLRTLAIKLLSENRCVYYLLCSTVTEEFRRVALESVLQAFAQGSKTSASKKE